MSTTTYVGKRPADADSRSRHPTARAATPKQRRKARSLVRTIAVGAQRREEPAPMAFYVLVVTIVVLTLLGLVMVLSASSISAIHQGRSGWLYFRRQVAWAVLGFVALWVAWRVPYATWRRFFRVGLFGSLALMTLAAMPGIGRSVNGARAWLSFGPVGFQPGELMKLSLLVYCADLLSRRRKEMTNSNRTLRPVLIVLCVAGGLLVVQKDLGNGIVMGAIVMSVLFFAGTPLRSLASAGLMMAGAATVFTISTPYRRNRWLAFLDLVGTRSFEGYQVYQARVALATGGLTGLGIGAGHAKWSWLPEAHTDFIFAIIGEELGLFGVVVVCALFIVFGYAGIQVALHTHDRFAMLLSGGITAWILVQAVINIGGVVGVMPLTGITLPFVSFGGTSLLITMTAAGLLLNVASQPPGKPTPAEPAAGSR